MYVCMYVCMKDLPPLVAKANRGEAGRRKIKEIW